jgi:hypothetical protein
MSFLPMYLITKTTLRGGRRLEKAREKFKEPHVDPAYPRSLPTIYRGTPMRQYENNNLVVIDRDINFQNWEYRFWALEPHKDIPAVAICRGCEQIEHREDMRRKHHRQDKCTTKLVEAYKLLLRDMRCVVCDTKVNNSEWGVPMCKVGQCLGLWKENSTPEALALALALVEQGQDFTGTGV